MDSGQSGTVAGEPAGLFLYVAMYAYAYTCQGITRGPRLPSGTRSRTLWPMSPIGLRVKELRTAKGWTQAELARQAGIRRATVNRIENARIKSIDLEVLEKLAKALGCDPGYLIVKTDG